MVATFENTVGILVKAYLDETLLKGHCAACAVGNICAAAVGAKVIDPYRGPNQNFAGWSEGGPEWGAVFYTAFEGRQYKRPGAYKNHTKSQIDATGYSWQDLARIEYAFETAQKGHDEAAEFAGLMAVVDVLADIHGIDLATAEASKLLFVKA